MYTEIKYLHLLSPRLPLFKRVKNNLWKFRCPICGDSKRNKTKTRGFVFEHKGTLLYKCHNCGVSMSLEQLINKLDIELYKEFKLEKFKENNPRSTPDMRKIKRVVSKSPVFKKDVLKDLIRIENLNTTHPAKEYLLKRRLPLEALYYTEKFKEWANSVKPNTFKNVTQDEGRIIIPFRTKEGDVFGFQGRSLSSTGLRYITILLEEEVQKIYGLDTVDYEKTIYITEGPLDSLFLKNCVAMAGADVNVSECISDDVVYVYDNEPRNSEITARLGKLIDNGEKVVIWPNNIKEKDINDMILCGHNVQQIVENHTYSGLQATLKFKEWKK